MLGELVVVFVFIQLILFACTIIGERLDTKHRYASNGRTTHLVIGRSPTQARRIMYGRFDPKENVRYVASANDLLGYPQTHTRVHWVGDYFRREDIDELRRYAALYGG